MTKSMNAVRDRKTDNRRISQNMEKAFKKMAQVFGYPNREYKDRVFIKFMMKPQRQLIVALKSRGYWWNSHENAWSTYVNKADIEWIKTIPEVYSKYI